MIKEVVPFAEVLATVVMITFKDLDVPFAFWIFEAEDSELFSCWNVFLDLNRAKVESLACLYVHSHVVRDIIECVAVLLQ